MASIRQRGENWQVVFSFRDSPQWVRSCGDDELAARLKVEEVELTIKKLRYGQLQLPEDTIDIAEFIWTGGQKGQKETKLPLSLGKVLEAYQKSSHFLNLAETGQATIVIHCKRLESILGKKTPLVSLSTRSLQKYADTRRQKVVGRTIQAEITTLRTMWNKFALPMGYVQKDWRSSFPQPVNLPKMTDKPLFQTYEEIASQVPKLQDSDSPDPRNDLWQSLYLQSDEVTELLSILKTRHSDAAFNSVYPWVYPAVAFACFTSFRRSTIQRALVAHVDFKRGLVSGRIKKEDHQKEETLRTVPILPDLIPILKEWLEGNHPGGKYLFCSERDVELSRMQLDKGLKAYLRKSKWSVIRGWHAFRHTFVSVATAKKVPQAVIDEFTGHSTEIRRRYRHLAPSTLSEGLKGLYD